MTTLEFFKKYPHMGHEIQALEEYAQIKTKALIVEISERDDHISRLIKKVSNLEDYKFRLRGAD